jgi:site-specific recombinase XerD
MDNNMEKFERWLQEKHHYTNGTARARAKAATQYKQWLTEHGCTIEEATTAKLLDHIGHLREQGSSSNNIRHRLWGIKQYYRYLQLGDPTAGLIIRQRGKKITHLLSATELQQVHENFTASKGKSNPGYYHHSDKLILSLIIYQALDIQDVYRLETSHVQLEKATVYIKGNGRQQSRILPLEACQIVPLQKYILETRKEILQQKDSTWFKGCDEKEAKLFVPACLHQIRLKLQWKKLGVKTKAQSKTIGIEIKNLRQLRLSRLAVWVKQHGLREAQYKAGFNTVSGIERYARESTEDLQKQLEQFHPWATELQRSSPLK